MKILSFIFIIIMLAAFTACRDDEKSESGSNPQQEQADEPGITTTELTVWNMTCKSCVNKITAALSDMDGVESVSVDLNAEKVTIKHDSGLDITVIEKMIETQGFNLP